MVHMPTCPHADVDIDIPRKQEIVLWAGMTEAQQAINLQLKDGSIMVSRLENQPRFTWKLSDESLCNLMPPTPPSSATF